MEAWQQVVAVHERTPTEKLLHVNHLASIRVAQVIIVTKFEYRPQGLMFKNLLSTAIIISQFYPSYLVVKMRI